MTWAKPKLLYVQYVLPCLCLSVVCLRESSRRRVRLVYINDGDEVVGSATDSKEVAIYVCCTVYVSTRLYPMDPNKHKFIVDTHTTHTQTHARD